MIVRHRVKAAKRRGRGPASCAGYYPEMRLGAEWMCQCIEKYPRLALAQEFCFHDNLKRKELEVWCHALSNEMQSTTMYTKYIARAIKSYIMQNHMIEIKTLAIPDQGHNDIVFSVRQYSRTTFWSDRDTLEFHGASHLWLMWNTKWVLRINNENSYPVFGTMT